MSVKYDIGDYNRGGFWTFVYSMVFTMVFFIYIAFIHSGVDLQEIEGAKAKADAAMQSPENADLNPAESNTTGDSAE